MEKPGTKLAIEVFGRHAPGMAHLKADDPATFLRFLAVDGEVLLAAKDKTVRLKAPPGPALLKWDSIFKDIDVEFVAKLPQGPGEKEKKYFGELCGCSSPLGKGSPRKALTGMLQAEGELDRLVAVTALGAIDDLPGVMAGLADARHPEVREQAVLVLRHWAGREPGQIKKMVSLLQAIRKLSQVQAMSMVHLLLGFDDQERAEPQTYDLLIGYLSHDRLPVRELARWHLVRLAPEGKDIGYDAAAPLAERQRAVARWRQLIPPGRVPKVSNKK
jgi:hypothetical protein